MPIELPKQYDQKKSQQRWLDFWEQQGYFHSRPDPSRKAYCIVIPPPNVTGALHMGHALNNTLQDVLIRWRRMQGYNALWLPGTDHAGIATQLMVERQLREEGTGRQQLGRERFLARMWEWKELYHDNIRQQLAINIVNRDISEESARATVTQTLANVRNAYWDLVFAQSAVDVALRATELADKLVEDNQARVAVGTLAPLDIVQAQAEAATRRQNLAAAEATAQTAELALKRFLVSGTDDPLWRQTIRPVSPERTSIL